MNPSRSMRVIRLPRASPLRPPRVVRRYWPQCVPLMDRSWLFLNRRSSQVFGIAAEGAGLSSRRPPRLSQACAGMSTPQRRAKRS